MFRSTASNRCDHAARAHHHARSRHHPPHGLPFTPGGRAKRGNIRAAVLTLLEEEPMHGYRLMERLEELSGGAWRPSPGSIYPTLQYLDDKGLIEGEEADGRRVYSLTAAGRAEVENVRRKGRDPLEAVRATAHDPRSRLRHAAFGLAAATKQVGVTGTEEQLDAATAILNDARKRIYGILAEGD